MIAALTGGALSSVLSPVFAAALWTLTPFFLLARRLRWRRLVPAGVITALVMSALGAATVIWMPHAVSDSAGRFGVIGAPSRC